MTDYHTPVRDMQFALTQQTAYATLAQSPAFTNCTAELASDVFDEAGKFADQVLLPLNTVGDRVGARYDNGEVCAAPGFKAAYEQFVAAGWNGLGGPEEFGGQGLGSAISAPVNEIWCGANLAFSLLPLLTQGAAHAIYHHANADLKARYLPKLISGQWSATMNLTESQAGSDLAQIRCKATPVEADGLGTCYALTGQKIFITWGEHDCTENIIHLVLARTPDAPPGVKGISLFLVPKFHVLDAEGTLGQRNGVRCVSIEHKLGIHASPTCVMSYGEDVPAIGFCIGELHRGLEYMFTMMNHARLGVGLEGIALSERAYQKAASFAADRIQGRRFGVSDPNGVPIIQHPDVQRMLLWMTVRTQAMRALAYEAAVTLDLAACEPDVVRQQAQQRRVDLLIPIVKGCSTEQAQEITALGVQVHGGMGYIEETGAAQFMRDARITTIYEGTTGIQALDFIGRKLSRDQGAAVRLLFADVTADLVRAGAAGAAFTDALKEALQLASDVVDWLLAQDQARKARAAASAVPALHLMGIVLGGWMMVRQWLAAQSPDVPDAKIKTAHVRFYFANVLPLAFAYGAQAMHGADSVLDAYDIHAL